MEKTNENLTVGGLLPFDPIVLIRDVAKRWLLILLVTLAVGVGTYILTDAAYEPQYRSNATFVVVSRGSGSTVFSNLSAAEDLTADTFEAALRGIHKFRGEAKLSVWLCSIAKRKYYQHLRRNGRIQAVPLEDAPLISSQDIEGEYLRQADKIDLYRALQALPPDLPGDGGRYASCSH